MYTIRTKAHLMWYIAKNTRRPAIARAIEDGGTEHLGFFSNISKDWSKVAGYITKIIGKEQVWYLGTFLNNREWSIYRLDRDDIDWASWEGDKPKTRNKLVSGDNPERYVELKNEAKLHTAE